MVIFTAVVIICQQKATYTTRKKRQIAQLMITAHATAVIVMIVKVSPLAIAAIVAIVRVVNLAEIQGAVRFAENAEKSLLAANAMNVEVSL
jgi:hypothetical protein